MITYPECWSSIGRPIEVGEIEEAILQTLLDIPCPNLSLSGGLDSSLMLYFMTKVFDKVSAFTIGYPETHPDIEYSRLVAKKFKNVAHVIYVPTAQDIAEETKKRPGPDVGVRLFYKFLAKGGISRIITCDGVDEYMAGYYDHQQHPDEETYYKYIRRLQDEHLEQLNKNSGHIRVYLPYLDEVILYLLAQIPISEKVDGEHRKKMMVQMAKGKIPDKVIERWKYGFNDVLGIKKARF